MRARSSEPRWACAVVATIGLLVGACAGGGSGERSSSTTERARADGVAQNVAIDRYLADIEAYWTRTIPDLYHVDLDPLDRLVPYRPSDPRPPPCNGVVAGPAFYAENALYCGVEDTIVYDAEGLIPRLRADHGTFAIGVLLAHEYSHAIQKQAGERGAALVVELQADCFAGAWAAGFRADDDLAVAPADIDAALRGYLDFADPGDTPLDDATAHGTAFERMAAFSDGFHDGAATCVGYNTDRPVLARRQPSEPVRSDGTVTGLVDALDAYWAEVAPTHPPRVVHAGVGGATLDCGRARRAHDPSTPAAVCIENDTVVFDEVGLRGLGVEGRASGYAVAVAYSQAGLVMAGARPATRELAIAAECAIGAFVASLDHDALLLVHDLDRVVNDMATFDTAQLWPDGIEVSLLARVHALRTGFQGGIDVCGIASLP